jgi:hypothetical protein
MPAVIVPAFDGKLDFDFPFSDGDHHGRHVPAGTLYMPAADS